MGSEQAVLAMRTARAVRRARLLGMFIALLALLGLPAGVTRAATGEAPELLQEGLRLFNGAEFDASLRVLRQAASRTGEKALAAKIQLYIGLNSALTERPGDARAAFELALSLDPLLQVDEERFSPVVKRLFEQVRSELRGELQVSSSSAAEPLLVFVDGRRLGTAPLARRLPIGRHLVHLKSPDGRARLSRDVVLEAGRTTRITAPAPLAPPRDEQQPQGRRRIWTWVATGAAAVTAGLALGFWVATNDQIDQHNRLVDTEPTKDRSELLDGIDAKRAVTIGMAATAGALTATAIALFFLEDRAGRAAGARRDAYVTPLIGDGTAGLLLEARF